VIHERKEIHDILTAEVRATLTELARYELSEGGDTAGGANGKSRGQRRAPIQISRTVIPSLSWSHSLTSSGGTNWSRSMAGAPSRAGRVRRALRDARGQRRPWPGRDAPRWRRTAAGIVRGFLRSVGSDGLVALTSTGPVVPYWIKSLVRPHRLAQDVALGLRAVDPVVKRGGRVHPPIGDRLPLLAEPGV
jgi:hypothetical protein